jgi:hypothetical protein
MLRKVKLQYDRAAGKIQEDKASGIQRLRKENIQEDKAAA